MDKTESQVMPVPPNLITALRAGFDAVASQVLVILIPVGLDLLMWLGPHLQVKTIIDKFLNALVASAQLSTNPNGDLFTTGVDAVHTAAAQYNLLSLLRTIPVGIPSLMASRLPIQTPKGIPIMLEIPNVIIAIAVAIGLILAGLVAGSLYYSMVTQIVMQGKLELKKVLQDWTWGSFQVISLAAAFLILFLAISIPSSCVISVITLFGLPLGQFALFLYIGVLLWLAFPLLFSAHGIFINHNNALTSVKRSMVMTRMTLPTTTLFIFVILVVGEGLNLLCSVPPETSWLTLLGVGGHAFISSSLLASSIYYYKDADHWAQETLKIVKSQAGISVKAS